ILSAFVADRGFPMFWMNPQTHDAAVALLGRTLRRVHELPLPSGEGPNDARELLRKTWAEVAGGVSGPAVGGAAGTKVLTDPPPPASREVVLSHNDVNPTNLIYDGERLLLLDWQTSGINDPLYDLATISVFLRMDDATCLQLISAHDGAETAALPARF